MSSVQFIVDNFRKRLHQASRSVLSTALGSTDGPLIPNDENEFPRVSLECREYDPPVFGSRYAQSLPAKNSPRSIRKSYKKMDLTKRYMETLELTYS